MTNVYAPGILAPEPAATNRTPRARAALRWLFGVTIAWALMWGWSMVADTFLAWPYGTSLVLSVLQTAALFVLARAVRRVRLVAGVVIGLSVVGNLVSYLWWPTLHDLVSGTIAQDPLFHLLSSLWAVEVVLAALVIYRAAHELGARISAKPLVLIAVLMGFGELVGVGVRAGWWGLPSDAVAMSCGALLFGAKLLLLWRAVRGTRDQQKEMLRSSAAAAR